MTFTFVVAARESSEMDAEGVYGADEGSVEDE